MTPHFLFTLHRYRKAMKPRTLFFGASCVIVLMITFLLGVWSYMTQSVKADKYYIHPRTTFFRQFPVQADVVMVGDSLTRRAIWADIFPAVKIANRGVGGNNTQQILNRMDTILSTKAQRAFVMAGTNDIRQGEAIDIILENYEMIIDQLREANMEVIIQSTLECSVEKCGIELAEIRELNAGLQKMAAKNNVVFLDINAELSSTETGLLSDYTHDGTHLLGKGYRKWGDMLRPFIEPN